MSVRIIVGDALKQLKTLPDNSVHCVVTSPPYYGLRDYGTASWEGGDEACDHRTKPHQTRDLGRDRAASGGTFHGSAMPAQDVPQFRDHCRKCGARRVDQQIGLEDTPAAYVARLVEVFQEVKRVIRHDATVWLNLGDGFRDKQLQGIPWRVAFALQDDGWYLRSDCIWSKPNPMPESVTDRPTKSHEYVFMLAKSGETTFWVHRDQPGTRMRPEPDYRWVHKETGEEVDRDPCDPERWKRVNLWSGRDYFFDQEAVREPHCVDVQRRLSNGAAGGHRESEDFFSARTTGNIGAAPDRKDSNKSLRIDNNAFCNPAGRNIRSVWSIATEPCDLAHFAVMPSELARRCILAGSSARGCCPACGAPHVRVLERGHPLVNGERNVGGRQDGFSRPKGGAKEWAQHRPPSTTGWRPSCSCPPDNPVPAVILDPFAGAGTTGLAAERLGRDAVLIELSSEYARMCRDRLDRARARRFIGDADRMASLPGQADLFQ